MIDPDYKIPRVEWARAIEGLARWRWVADGVLAVDNSPGSDAKPDYRMNLEFELLDVKLRRDAETLSHENQEGDAKGWGSTAEYKSNKEKRALEIKQLIENAVKRGDSVVSH